MTDVRDMAAAPDLSVVVAVTGSADSTRECIDSLLEGCGDARVEIILSGADRILRDVPDSPSIVRVPCADSDRSPRLWGKGLSAARGRILAVTEDTTRFDPAWISRIVDAHDQPGRIVGGPVEPLPDGSTAYWTAYFFDYSRFMLPREPGRTNLLAGTNISWDAELPVDVESPGGQEFWKTEWLEQRRSAGDEVLFEPGAVAFSGKSWTLSAYLKLQYHQGRCYGGRQGSDMTWGRRSLRATGMILLPFVMTARTAAIVLSKRRHRGAFFRRIPSLFLTAASWSAGELLGLARGRGDSCRHVR